MHTPLAYRVAHTRLDGDDEEEQGEDDRCADADPRIVGGVEVLLGTSRIDLNDRDRLLFDRNKGFFRFSHVILNDHELNIGIHFKEGKTIPPGISQSRNLIFF